VVATDGTGPRRAQAEAIPYKEGNAMNTRRWLSPVLHGLPPKL
jgi:hypothetical protein